MGILAILLYALLALVSFLLYKVHAHLNYFKNAGIAYETPNLLMGNMQGIRTKHTFGEIFCNYYRKFKGSGPFVGFYFFQNASAFILDTQLAKNILIKDFAKLSDRGFFYNEKDDPLSTHLFSLQGQHWRSLRNKLTPTFTSGKMKFMFPTVLKVGEQFVEVFADMIRKSAVVEIKEILARFTTDIIGTCAFGIDCNSLKDPEAEFRIMGRKSIVDMRHNTLVIAFMMSFPQLARKLRMKQTPDHIEEFFMRIVRENVAYREQNNIRCNDFMDLLIELKNNKLMKTEDGLDSKNLTLEEVAAQAFVFFQASFETSSSAMAHAIYELAQHEHIQQRAREEVQQVLAKHNQEFSYECMRELHYMEQVIAETLRLHTLVTVLFRQAVVDYPVPGNPNFVIPKGMLVFIPTEAIHHDAEFFPNPHVFDPERFTPEMVQARDSVLYLPFGDGPRNCIGMRFGQMQIRIGLALLLKNFKFSVCKQTQIPLTFNPESFLKSSKEGIYLKVERISEQAKLF